MGVRFSPVLISREQVPVLQAAVSRQQHLQLRATSHLSSDSSVPSPEYLCLSLGVWKAKGTHTMQEEEISHPTAASVILLHSTLLSGRTRLGKPENNKAQ